MEKKKCAKCYKKKSKKHFYKNSVTLDGLGSYCKECANAVAKAHRHDNLDKYRKNERAYRCEHIDKINAYHKEYYAKPKVVKKTTEYQKKYKDDNKEKLSKYHKEWSEKNKKKIALRALEYYYKNKAAILADRKKKYLAKKK